MPRYDRNISAISESIESSNRQETGSNFNNDLCKDLWIYSIGNEREPLPSISNQITTRSELSRDAKSMSPVRKSLQTNRRPPVQSAKYENQIISQYSRRN